MPNITYNQPAVAALGGDIVSASAQLAEIVKEFGQQRGRLDPEFEGSGAQTYYERQMLSERGLQELSNGLNHLGAAVRKALDGAIATDLAGRGMFG